MHNYNRRAALFSLLILPIGAAAQKPEPPIIHLPPPLQTPDSHGKSKEEIAEENREEALRDADELVKASQELRDELKKAGSYVVPISSVKKTKEIEKLARRIRGRLKA